jgi:hypothetical protein
MGDPFNELMRMNEFLCFVQSTFQRVERMKKGFSIGPLAMRIQMDPFRGNTTARENSAITTANGDRR